MWKGGVAIWNRSSAVRPSADPQMTMAAPMLEWVWRTALGMPVVPELNTSTASVWSQSSSTAVGLAEWMARAATAGSSSRWITRSASRGGRRRWVSPSVMASTGSVRPAAWATSASFHAELIITAEAPSLRMPKTAVKNSGRFEAITATR